jgi:hypothetical protein
MKRPKESRPSEFEVAMEKGDYKLPYQVPTKWTIFDVAKTFIIFRRLLDCPDEKTIDWIIVWVVCKGDIKITAIELGIEVPTLYKRIERLDKIYKAKRSLLAGD